jgi:hypothetical protein
MVRPHGDGGVWSSLRRSAFLLQQKGSDDAVHINIPIEMVGLGEIPVVATLRRWTKLMREANVSAMATRSFRLPAPNEPVQRVMPFDGESMALRILVTSSLVLTTRGRPRMGQGGSSG